MAFIDVIRYEQAEGRLREIYDEIRQKRGKLAEVHQIQSLNPESIMNHMDLYMTLMFGKSPLRRYQREMIAVVVSGANNCRYCIEHHTRALEHYWKDKDKTAQLAEDFNQLDLKEADQAICSYAQYLTKEPSETNEDRFILPMKQAGLDDRAILDATMITGYFNFVNRIILGLGVHIEKDRGVGYKY